MIFSVLWCIDMLGSYDAVLMRVEEASTVHTGMLFHSYSNCPATGMLIGPLPVCLVLNDVANKITGPILVWTKVLWVG